MRNALISLQESKIREVANAGMGRSDVLPFWFGESDEVTPAARSAGRHPRPTRAAGTARRLVGEPPGETAQRYHRQHGDHAADEAGAPAAGGTFGDWMGREMLVHACPCSRKICYLHNTGHNDFSMGHSRDMFRNVHCSSAETTISRPP